MSRLDNVQHLVGGFSGDGGANQDDSVKASLDLAHTNLDNIIASQGGFTHRLPIHVSKTLLNWTAAAQNLFVVTGGPIKVMLLTGTVAVALESITMNLSIVAAVTTPSADIDIASLLDCTGDAAGTLYKLNATFGSTLVTVPAGIAVDDGVQFIMPIGTINMTSGAVEDDGGSIVWRMTYRKLSGASTVTVAGS